MLTGQVILARVKHSTQDRRRVRQTVGVLFKPACAVVVGV